MRIRRQVDRNLRKQTRKRALKVEVLCDRVVLDGSGLGVSDPLPWFDPGALTYSYAPDGTPVAGEQSQLFSQLDALAATADWQQQFDQAFNAWLSPLNATTNQVSDSGDPFGITGRTHGESRFGDIRIAAVPLSQHVYATSIPHSAMVQGTWAGDILINANAQWNNLQEVFAVALHEFGHVLGLPHSDDPASPMFIHGVHDAVAPTAADIEQLRDLYVGIDFEDHHEESDTGEESDHRTRSEPELARADDFENEHNDRRENTILNLAGAIPLSPAIGSTIRYSAMASVVVDSAQPIIYRLDPTSLEAEDIENLHVVLQSSGSSPLLMDVVVVDSLGRSVESTVLHHGQGSLVVQAVGVDSRETHYVVVTPSSVGVQVGEFEIVVDYGRELRLSHAVGEITLSEEQPALEQSFNVASSRLVHLHVEFSEEESAPAESGVRAMLLDADGFVLAQVALTPGTSRSAPLTFLAAGDYVLQYVVDSASNTPTEELRVNVFIDEVSIDVGPGVADPTGNPSLPCDEPATDPDYCFVYVPIIPSPPTAPAPVSEEPTRPWWWDYGFTCSDYTGEDVALARAGDPLWWEFYVEACQGVMAPTNPAPTNPAPTNPAPTNPAPTNPAPPNPAPTNPAPTNPAPATPEGTDLSPWQNRQSKFDVSGNAAITAQDALIVINLLGQIVGETINVTDVATGVFADVNGDFVVTSLDALMVINHLGRARAVGEAVFASAVTPSSESSSETQGQRANDAVFGMLF